MSDAVDVLLEEALAQKPLSLALIRRLFGWTRPYRPFLFLNLAATVLFVASQLAGPKLVQFGIDHFLTHIDRASGAARTAAIEGILLVSAAYCANLIFGWRINVLQIMSAIRVG